MKRYSQSPQASNLLQSPVLNDLRNSTSSTSNTTGLIEISFRMNSSLFHIGSYLMSNHDHDDEDFEEEPIKLWT
jgi:hypothetical protein